MLLHRQLLVPLRHDALLQPVQRLEHEDVVAAPLGFLSYNIHASDAESTSGTGSLRRVNHEG